MSLLVTTGRDDDEANEMLRALVSLDEAPLSFVPIKPAKRFARLGFFLTPGLRVLVRFGIRLVSVLRPSVEARLNVRARSLSPLRFLSAAGPSNATTWMIESPEEPENLDGGSSGGSRREKRRGRVP